MLRVCTKLQEERLSDCQGARTLTSCKVAKLYLRVLAKLYLRAKSKLLGLSYKVKAARLKYYVGDLKYMREQAMSYELCYMLQLQI